MSPGETPRSGSPRILILNFTILGFLSKMPAAGINCPSAPPPPPPPPPSNSRALYLFFLGGGVHKIIIYLLQGHKYIYHVCSLYFLRFTIHSSGFHSSNSSSAYGFVDGVRLRSSFSSMLLSQFLLLVNILHFPIIWGDLTSFF